MTSVRSKLQERAQGDDLKEHPDDMPVELPAGWERPPTLEETIQKMIRTAMSNQAVQDGFDSFDEFDDFEEHDGEALPESPYEFREMIDEYVDESTSQTDHPDQPVENDPVVDPQTSVAMSAPTATPGSQPGDSPSSET